MDYKGRSVSVSINYLLRLAFKVLTQFNLNLNLPIPAKQTLRSSKDRHNFAFKVH